MTAGRIVSVLPAPPATAQTANLPGKSWGGQTQRPNRGAHGALLRPNGDCADRRRLRRVTPSL
jgi:hypothetical protein